MKLAKLSLAAIVVAGLATSSFAAENLADAFKNGKVSGELRAWYWDRERAGTTNDVDLINTGLYLGYVTDSFMGFSMGATMQSNFSPFADSEAKTKMSEKKGEYGSGAVLSEAYLAYKMKNTTVKIGRQFISTPLVAGSGSRMIKQAFEAAMITNTDLPQTTLAAGVVTKFQNRTDGTGNTPDFEELNENHDYAYTLLAINKSIPGVTLTGQWAQLENNFDEYYAEVAYAAKANNFTYGLAANYMLTSYDAAIANDDTADMYGAKVSFGMGDFNSYIAYSKIGDGRDMTPTTLGGGAQPVFAKGYQFMTGTYTDNTEAYSLDANYNFKAISTLIGARYTEVQDNDTGAAAAKAAYTDVYVNYDFAGALKGLGVQASYEDWSKDVEGSEFWFRANYKF